MHFEFLPPKKVIHYMAQHEKFVPSYMKLLWCNFHKSITFLWGKNSKFWRLIMNGF